MRTSGVTENFGDATARRMARFEEHRRKVESGEAPPPKTDANGNIIPSPSARRPNIFDGLNLSQDTPPEIG